MSVVCYVLVVVVLVWRYGVVVVSVLLLRLSMFGMFISGSLMLNVGRFLMCMLVLNMLMCCVRLCLNRLFIIGNVFYMIWLFL